MTYLLVGNYGVGNIGDEALREYFLQRFPQVTWRVVSAHPQKDEFQRFPCGVRSFISFGWMKTLRELKKSDGMVLGGGSLFTDVESRRACLLWWVQVFFAWALRKKVMLAFQGIGPFRTAMGERLARSAVRKADFISVRDPQSLERVQSWKLKSDVLESFDPVFALVDQQEMDLAAEKVLIVIPRENSGEPLLSALHKILQSGRFTRVHILLLQPDSLSEQKFSKSVQDDVQVESSVSEVRTLHDLSSGVAQGSLVLTQRFHGGVVALALGKELDVVPQEKHDKLDALSALLHSTPAHGRKERLQALVQKGEDALRSLL